MTGTGNFIHSVSQGEIDTDSANLLACRMYGLPRLLPYDEGFSDGVTSPTSKLIDAGKIAIVTNVLNYTEGENKLRILLELGAYYLFKPGNEKKDLDSALLFIQRAQALSVETGWQKESLNLLGKYYFQAGNIAESQRCFLQTGDVFANGKYLPVTDPRKLSYLESSLALFRKQQMKEKEMEVRMEIANAYPALAERQLQEILLLQKAIGFRHTLYTTYALSGLAVKKGDHMTSLSYTRQSIENMQETGDVGLACVFYMQMGNVYSHLDKPAEALTWFKKSYAGKKSLETQIFWYKGFMSAAHLLAYLNRGEEALSLIQEMVIPFPPASTFDKMYLALIKGYCYEQQQNNALAEENYNTFTSIADQLPPQHINGGTPEAFYRVSLFYFNQGQRAKARTYLQKALAFTSGQIDNLAGINLLLSKLDSAAGRYASALQYHVQYAFYKDSIINVSQRKQMEALTEKYETEKKSHDSKLLTLQQAEQKQSGFLRYIMLGGLLSLLIIAALLYNQYRLKREADHKNTDLQYLAKEKEWLLKEVHHRVKNNLQTLVSLLESQSVSAVQNSQNRAYAMSLIHQKLYLRENMTSIDVRSYLPELVHHLRDRFNVSRRIHIHLEIPHLELDVSQAVPITLVISEAITNSIKHAFPGKELGQEITISMEQSPDNEITLIIADNGIGLPADFEEEHNSGLGLKFMQGLTEDINGTFIMESEIGTVIRIHFMANMALYKTTATLNLQVV
ncbi:sensor histidine kinase [Chitinophaga sp. SYP-B3965]|uniref:tetratricopeptide repeat-containing sensor histidine kinase n=1 Tax=Chitinophaga sp. SYP-B3965 TaxID=2663120 RepID=UPI001566A5F5